MLQKLIPRKNLRLKEHDYSLEGQYFITICTENKKCILSKIIGGDAIETTKVELMPIGQIVNSSYLNLEKEFCNIKLHDYVIMPNHIHGIIEICKTIEGEHEARPYKIGDIICAFKSRTTGLIIQEIKLNNMKRFDKRLWQRNYYEHIIRNEEECLKVKQYIINNPMSWTLDEYYNS